MNSLNRTNKPTSTKEVAIALEKQGVAVATYFEGHEGPIRYIAFFGGEETGHKVVKSIREMGLYPEDLYRVWPYAEVDENGHPADGNGIPDPYWKPTFFNTPPLPAMEFNSVDELIAVLPHIH